MIFLNESTSALNVPGMNNGDVDSEMLALCESAGISITDYDYLWEASEAGAAYMLIDLNEGWNTLNQDLILCEAHSIIKGNPTILHEGVGKWWEAISNFVKKWWGAFTGWLKRMWDKIYGFFANAQKWVQKHKTELASAGSKVVQVKTYPNYANAKFPGLPANLLKAFPTGNTAAEYENWKKEEQKKADEDYSSSKLKEQLRGAKETSDVNFTVNVAVQIINGFNTAKAEAQNLQKNIDNDAKAIINLAKAGLSDAKVQDNPEEVKMLKAKIDAKKFEMAFGHRCMSIYLSVLPERCSAAFAACRKALAKDETK